MYFSMEMPPINSDQHFLYKKIWNYLNAKVDAINAADASLSPCSVIVFKTH